MACRNTNGAIRKPGQMKGIEFPWRAIHNSVVAGSSAADEPVSPRQIADSLRFSISQRFHVDFDVVRRRTAAHGESHLQQEYLPMENDL